MTATGPSPLLSAESLGSSLVAQLEATYAAVRAEHPELPAEVVFVTGEGTRTNCWGSFTPKAWRYGDGQPHEIFISGEVLELGGARVYETILHEFAHLLAHVRGTRDHNSWNRYHNRNVANTAIDMVLAPPLRPDRPKGFHDAYLNPATEERDSERIEAIGTALNGVHRPPRRKVIPPSKDDDK